MAFAPDASRFFSASADKTVRSWDATAKWSDHATVEGMIDRVLSIDFSPNGKWLATGSGEPSRSGEIKIWDVASGKLLMELKDPHSDTVFGLQFSPDSSMLASCGADKMVKVFDVESGRELRKFEGHTHHVMDVAWKPDGRQLVSAGADNVLKVWDMATGEQVRTIGGHNKQVTSLRFQGTTPNVVSCGGDAQVKMYNSENGGNVRNFPNQGDFLYSVSLPRDGSLVVAGGQDSVIRIWGANDGQLKKQISPVTPPPAAQARAN
jgi:WD40 repeat protein